ncbi:MAG: hypothetical protein LBL87_00670 [Ruminococcus sp.]|jgi:hypothetical protein|nr:hypothetical protein [Ruminococcus sp.]
MDNDTLLKSKGMQVLTDNLGIVEAERFIFLMNGEHFDYTEWQKDLFKEMPIEEISRKAMELRKRRKAIQKEVTK